MKRTLAAALALGALVLTGCSAASEYSSPNELLDAYKAAGGSCQDAPEEIPESMLGDGAHGLMCATNETLAMIIVFDDAKARDRYVAQVDTGDYDGTIVGGTRWAIAGQDLPDLGPLGGAVLVD